MGTRNLMGNYVPIKQLELSGGTKHLERNYKRFDISEIMILVRNCLLFNSGNYPKNKELETSYLLKDYVQFQQ